MPRSDIIRLLIGDVAFVAVFVTLCILVEACIKRRYRQNNSSTVTSSSSSCSSPSPAATAALIASAIIEIEQLKRIRELGWAIIGEEGEGESTDCCAICSEEFKAKESVRVLSNCAHRFHINCIDEWLTLQSSFRFVAAKFLRSSSTVHSLQARGEG